MSKVFVNTQEETERLGMKLAKVLKPGSVVALCGDLGAGKTTLTKAIAKGLGITSLVTSPTFTIIHEYKEGRLPFYHFDVYRLDDEEELHELGYEEYFYGDGVSVVEWADRVEGCLPKDAIRIKIFYGDGENERIFHIENIGD